MASNYTENYGLCQWEATDQVLRTDFNEDNAKVDAALETLTNTVKGHTTELGTKGNCQIYRTTYVGTGAYGPSSPVRLTFPKPPLAILLTSPYGVGVFIQGDWGYIVLSVNQVTRVTTTWSGNTVSWYHTESPNYHQNKEGVTYYVVALMEN